MVRFGPGLPLNFHIVRTVRLMQKTVRSRSLVALLLLLLTAGLVFVLGACADGEPTADEAPAAAETEPEEAEPEVSEPVVPETYTVRGEIVELPDPEDPTSGFFVYHEAIDEFRGIDGEVVGMSSMTMPFPVADGVDLEGLGRGDIVEFDLQVDWEGDPATLVTRVEELPQDTILEFRGARPPGQHDAEGASGGPDES